MAIAIGDQTIDLVAATVLAGQTTVSVAEWVAADDDCSCQSVVASVGYADCVDYADYVVLAAELVAVDDDCNCQWVVESAADCVDCVDYVGCAGCVGQVL